MVPVIRALRHLVIGAIALMPAVLSGSIPAVASPTGQAPTPQPSRPILLTDPVPDPRQLGVQWFAPTGHTLRGAFLDYWNRYGGLAQFGYPITEEFTEPSGPNNAPLDVQYFERNRFEHHAENAGTPYEVLLGALGREFHAQEPPAPLLPGPARYFEQTGHNLSGALKTYWDTHGGLFVHGFPITEQFEEVNPVDHKRYTVQYFERSRFELHPENAGTQYEVLLGLLGTQLSQKKGYPYGWYPLLGHATDYSWIAGIFSSTRMCFDPICDCRVFIYAQSNRQGPTSVGRGNDWRTVPGGDQMLGAAFLVVFGELSNAPEHPICHVRAYVANRVQRNPAR